MKHFRETWIDSVCSGWYEGLADKIPSTDNGLESANNLIKLIHTLRDRMNIGQYMTNPTDIIRNWSIDRTKMKPFHETPKVDGTTWTKAYHALFTKNPIVKTTNSEEVFILKLKANIKI